MESSIPEVYRIKTLYCSLNDWVKQGGGGVVVGGGGSGTVVTDDNKQEQWVEQGC